MKARTGTAFTLIEMVLATALSASVMVALLGVMTRLTRGQKFAAGLSTQQELEAGLVSLVETDLVNAREFESKTDGFVLVGFGRLDSTTKQVRHRPVTVSYQVRPAGGRSWLMRQQVYTDPAEGTLTTQELVCAGVEKISLAGVSGSSDGPTSRPGEGRSVPEAVRLTVSFGRDGESGGLRQLERVLFLW